MYIVKNLNDYITSEEDRKALASLKEVLLTDLCYVPIKNKAFLKKYFSPVNDLVAYSTAVACGEPIRALGRR